MIPLVSAEKLESVEDAPNRHVSIRSGREDKHPHMLLILGWLSLDLIEASIYEPRIPHLFVYFNLLSCIGCSRFSVGARAIYCYLILSDYFIYLFVFRNFFGKFSRRKRVSSLHSSRIRSKILWKISRIALVKKVEHYQSVCYTKINLDETWNICNFKVCGKRITIEPIDACITLVLGEIKGECAAAVTKGKHRVDGEVELA